MRRNATSDRAMRSRFTSSIQAGLDGPAAYIQTYDFADVIQFATIGSGAGMGRGGGGKKIYQGRIGRLKIKSEPEAYMLRRCHVAFFHARFCRVTLRVCDG
jgi:hypothetical protein